ncbi:hypothetical protein MLD38_017208 [Melastoma candidum]|uniref:Uncharacterized protein n=1 Tax=Melastoma candidum TaxID=119954 RepID=A0ACB9QT04_9MYRT|nr:hypothetical protein MLD38_017208 [Melastoma candidum]
MQGLKGTVVIPHNSTVEVGPGAQDEYQASLSLFTLKPLELEDDYICLSSKLSANPMLIRRTLSTFSTAVGDSDLLQGRSLPCFDFSSVGHPLKLCVAKADVENNSGHVLHKPVQNHPAASAATVRNSQHGEKGHDADSSLNTSAEYPYRQSTLVSNGHEGLDFKNVSGGSGWETMLSGRRNEVANAISGWKEESSAYFEMPLDFVVDKCLVQEIFLHYKFVSTVTIKLLLEGFHLQEHLISLRGFHFLEVADWADMFITSLWQQKKVIMNVQQGVSDLQGLLELSIQRSSRERDLNRDRLFIFSKGDKAPPQATPMGIHLLDNVGLGYRVDWPINIILTPTALEIYDNIFNFLIKVKLALLSLTTVWSLLKGLNHSHRQSSKSHAHVQETKKIVSIAKIRHQLSHFVSMLQQYLQSQLSHVSWSKFLQALQHKVKDMIDLESAHMDYLLESLHICFLSHGTQDISGAIQSILQTAIEFHDIVNRGVREAIDDGDPMGCKLQIVTSQVSRFLQYSVGNCC